MITLQGERRQELRLGSKAEAGCLLNQTTRVFQVPAHSYHLGALSNAS